MQSFKSVNVILLLLRGKQPIEWHWFRMKAFQVCLSDRGFVTWNISSHTKRLKLASAEDNTGIKRKKTEVKIWLAWLTDQPLLDYFISNKSFTRQKMKNKSELISTDPAYSKVKKADMSGLQ